ncbi:MAG: acyl-CoA dehydrogenase family protein [Pseudomonadota bacterium]
MSHAVSQDSLNTDHLAWPFFEPRHRAWQARIAGFAQGQVPGLVDHHDIDGSCRRLVRAMGEAGLLEAVVAKGEGERLDVRTLCLARETLAYGDGLADFAFAMQGLGTGPISLFGTPEQKARWLPHVASGEAIAAFALSEPDAGSDVAALALTATPDGPDHVRLDGEKTWISNGGIADQYVVFARTGEAPGARGLTAFAVPADAPGLSVAERLEVSAPHPLARLRFDGVRVPLSERIGAPGAGFKVAMATLDVFRSTVGAAATGFARRALDLALDHAASRKLFGGTLSDLQIVQAGLADMVADVETAALAVYRAAWTKDAGAERVTKEAALAKMLASENAGKVVDRAVQIFGGAGIISGAPVEVLTRDVRALRIYEGATEIQKVVIARSALKDREAQRAAPAALQAAE